MSEILYIELSRNIFHTDFSFFMIWNLDCPEKSLALKDPVLRWWQVSPPVKNIVTFLKIENKSLPGDKLAQN